MKLPRAVSGADLVKALGRLGYQVSRQTGSHIRLTLEGQHQFHITIPNHNPIRIGTLGAIISDISTQLETPKQELIQKLFG